MNRGLAWVFIGGIVGAGFASGEEIWLFFGRYGSFGFLGIVLSGFMLGAFGGAILSWAAKERTRDHRGLFERLMGKRTALFADIVLSCFLFIIVAVMEAAGGEIGRQFSPASGNLFYIYLIILAGLRLWRTGGIVAINSILVPVLLLLLLLISAASFKLPAAADPLPKPALPWWLAAFFYASYNLLLVFSALVGLAEKLDSLKAGRSTSFFASFILSSLNCIVLAAILRQPQSNLPILALANSLGSAFRLCYIVTLFCAVFTSLLAAVWGLGKRLENIIPELWGELVILILAWPVSQFGFAKIVAGCYPLFGSLGFLLLILLWAGSVRKNRVALLWVK